jgi:hypothetical protein
MDIPIFPSQFSMRIKSRTSNSYSTGFEYPNGVQVFQFPSTHHFENDLRKKN